MKEEEVKEEEKEEVQETLTEEEKFEKSGEEETSSSEVKDDSIPEPEKKAEEEHQVDSEKFDERGVSWKNVAKEAERKYLKALEEKAPTQSQPPLSKEEAYEGIAKEFNISNVDDVPGFIALNNAQIAAAIKPLQDKLSNYDFRDQKETAKKAVSVGKDDFSNLSVEIDKELDTLSLEVRGNPEQLKIEVERAYWAAKGKKSVNVVRKAVSKATQAE